MKKRIIAILFSFVFLVNCFSSFAYAEEIGRIEKKGEVRVLNDALTMGMVTSAIYSISQDAGLSWIMGGMTGTSANQYLTGEVNSYLGGYTLAEKFGTEALRLESGKLIVPAMVYNGIVDFLNSFNAKHDYSDPNNYMYVSFEDYDIVPAGTETSGDNSRAIYYYTYKVTGTMTQVNGGWWETRRSLTNDGLSVTYNPSLTYPYIIRGVYSYDYAGSRQSASIPILELQSPNMDSVKIDADNYIAPTVIDPSWGWVGQFDGIPDTNLEELMAGIFEDIADNILVVEGDIGPIDPPQPTPTPIPIDPDTPLSDVPWHEVDDTLNDIDTNIGDIADTLPDIIPTINQQTETLENIEEALEDEDIDWPKFDLRGLFPFCIPFDIYNMLKALDASPTAPHVQLPFVIQSIGFSYMLDLDFSPFDPVAAIMRQMELICYGLALAWATSKVIKW